MPTVNEDLYRAIWEVNNYHSEASKHEALRTYVTTDRATADLLKEEHTDDRRKASLYYRHVKADNLVIPVHVVIVRSRIY